MYKVLIVDDERIIREGLKSSIDWVSLKYQEVLLAKDGIEGKDIIITQKPDLVITDIKMPRMNGIEMMEATRDIDYQKIILSSYDDFDYAKAAIKFQVADYLLKPIDEEELIELVKNLTISHNSDTGYELPDSLRILLITDYSNYYITQTVNYIKNYSHTTLEIEDIASVLEVSPSYLMRIFKKYTDVTIKDFINRYRIYQSLPLLAQHMKIYEVAEMVGYNDYKAFIYNFRKYMNITPNQFIKSL